MPMHDVAPSAVTIAVAIDAIICTMNLMVSLFVIVYIFLPFYLFNFLPLSVGAFAPRALIALAWVVAALVTATALNATI